MGRGGSSARGGGGGGGRFIDKGAFGTDGTITDKQKTYVTDLLTQEERTYSGPMGPIFAARAVHYGPGGDRLAEDRATELSMREFGPKLIAAADRWAASINANKLSKDGASRLIDSLRSDGRVGTFVRQFGGETVADRVALMNKIMGGRKYTVKANRRGREEIWLVQ